MPSASASAPIPKSSPVAKPTRKVPPPPPANQWFVVRRPMVG